MTGGEFPKCVRASMTMEFADGTVIRFEAVEPADAMINAAPVPEMDAGAFAHLPVPALSFQPPKATLSITPDFRRPMTMHYEPGSQP